MSYVDDVLAKVIAKTQVNQNSIRQLQKFLKLSAH